MCQGAGTAGLVVGVVPYRRRRCSNGAWLEDLIELAMNLVLDIVVTPVYIRFCQAQDINIRALRSDGHRLNLTEAIARFDAVDVLKVQSYVVCLFGQEWIAPRFIGPVIWSVLRKIVEAGLDDEWG